MSDDLSPLHWTDQQWASLRAAVQESARKARVASSFLPLSGPLPPEQTTVPSQWMSESDVESRQRGESEKRLETVTGRTLHLTTIACNVYLRGSEVADPELGAAKSMLRRAAEVLARLEDAIVFNGLGDDPEGVPTWAESGDPIVKPTIYRITGGRGHTGLLQAPGKLWREKASDQKKAVLDANRALVRAILDGDEKRRAEAQQKLDDATTALTNQAKRLGILATPPSSPTGESKGGPGEKSERGPMCVSLDPSKKPAPIVNAVVAAISKLEERGQFGPFAVVLDDRLFGLAHAPEDGSLVLPSDRILPFLGGGPLLRSSTIPKGEGMVVALAGSPVELVVATDMDVKFLEITLEPRYVLRVFERFVLRIKQLDAVCAIAQGGCRDFLRHHRPAHGKKY
jgi:uncharacterized linocin/CFP29 family protein